MKKVLFSLAVVAIAAAFTSCNKNCDCTTYLGDEGTTTEVKLDDLNTAFAQYAENTEIKKCSDLNNVTTLEGLKYGVVCK